MNDLVAHVRRAARSLCSRPAYLIVCLLVLSGGIAAQLAIVAVVDALVFRPPSAQAPEQVVLPSSLPNGTISVPDFKDIEQRNTCFSSTFAYGVIGRAGLNVGDDFVTGACATVTGRLFSALNFAPGAGRLLEPADDLENAAPVAVVSHAFAETMKLTLGSIVKVNGTAFTVVGVLPARFRSFEPATKQDVWIPMARVAAVMPKTALTNRALQFVIAGGRLKPGMTLARAQAELDNLARQIAQENPVQNHGMSLFARSWAQFRFSRDGSARVMILLGALVGALFALAFTNFFALTLLRLLTRRRELAVKVAIGATSGHLARWLLGEVLAIAATAGGLGWALAHGLLRILATDPKVNDVLENAGVRLDLRTAGVVGAAVLVCAAIVWLIALRHAARVDVLSAIKESATSPRRKTAFAALFAAQLGIAFFLLATALSFAGALRSATARAFPFRTDNMLLFDVSFRHLGVEGPGRIPAAQKFIVALRDVPGVSAVAASSNAPLDGGSWTNVMVNDRDPALEPDKGLANRFVATAGFFDAAGIALQEGRAIEARDIESGVRVAVVNRSMADRYWPGASALGKTFRPWENGTLYTIVGVVADTPTGTTTTIRPGFFLPWAQSSQSVLTYQVAVECDSAEMRRAIADRLRSVWPYRNVPALRSMRDQIDQAAADLTTAVRIVLSVAALAIVVTAIGLYFFSAYAAEQSLKDAAVRQALGARAFDILATHVARYRVAIAAGLGLGVALVFAAGAALRSLGLTLSSVDAADMGVAAGLLTCLALIGITIPARRILRLDLTRLLADVG